MCIRDRVMCKLLESLGATVDPELDENNVDITAGSVLTYEAPYELVKDVYKRQQRMS